jgi:hypothetical protein
MSREKPRVLYVDLVRGTVGLTEACLRGPRTMLVCVAKLVMCELESAHGE